MIPMFANFKPDILECRELSNSEARMNAGPGTESHAANTEYRKAEMSEGKLDMNYLAVTASRSRRA